jgi:hypothetical protein
LVGEEEGYEGTAEKQAKVKAEQAMMFQKNSGSVQFRPNCGEAG